MELKVIAGHSGRLSTFLKQELQLSTGLMNRLKWNEKLLVNGIPRHADYPVEKGDEIVALLDDPAPEYPAEKGALTVLYEDEHLLCVDKPSGMLIHPSRSCFTGTLANFVLGYYEETNQKCAFHPVTRLDRDTFGVVLLAKNAHIHAKMNQLQSQGLLEKTYEALIYGRLDPPEGIIDVPIGRRPLPSLLRYVTAEGKPSVTRYKLLETKQSYSRVWLQPVTGRTHQLRVHCAHLGCPILGDPQYGTEQSKALSKEKGYTTQKLCAAAVAFPHPVTDEMLQVRAESIRIL